MLGLEPGEGVPFSAVEGTGAEALWARIAEVAGEGNRVNGPRPEALEGARAVQCVP